MAFSESNEKIIYAGTGEGFFNLDGIEGSGIFKSTNKGNSWKQLKSTANNPDLRTVNKIVVDPHDPNILVVCTQRAILSIDFKSGIYKSEDGGESWQETYTSENPIQDTIYTPGDFNTLYAAENSVGVLKSKDAGDTWQLSNQGMVPNNGFFSGRIELAIAPTKPNRIFASVEGFLSGSGSDLYISSNRGKKWSIVVEQDGGTNFDFFKWTGWI